MVKRRYPLISRSRGVSTQRGVTLLESLIAVVILAIGLLGVIALQVRGLHNAHASHQRTLASIIATDAGERLWIALGELPVTTESETLDIVTEQWLTHWQSGEVADNRLTLPGLDGLIVADPASVDIQHYIVTVTWTDTRFVDDEDSGSFTFTYRASLPDTLGTPEEAP